MHRFRFPGLIATSLLLVCSVGCDQQSAEQRPEAVATPPATATPATTTPPTATQAQQAAAEPPAAEPPVDAPPAESSATITTATLPPPRPSTPRVVAAQPMAATASAPLESSRQSAAAPAPTAKKLSQGATVSGEGFATWLQSVGEYTAGKPGQVLLVLESKAPYKCNAEYPYKFTFGAAPKGVSYPSAVVRDAAIDKKKATLTLPIAPSAAGEATIGGTFNFSVCTEERCLVEKRELSLTIQIK